MALVKLLLQRLVHVLQAHPQFGIFYPQHLVRLVAAKHIRFGVDLLACTGLATGHLVERRAGEGVDDIDDVLPVEGTVRGDESVAAGGGDREGFVVREGDVADLKRDESAKQPCYERCPTYVDPVSGRFLQIVVRLLALDVGPKVGDRGAISTSATSPPITRAKLTSSSPANQLDG